MLTELQRIRREHHLTSAQLAEEANLPLRVVYLCEIGGLVAEEDARKILKVLSRLTGKLYTLETVDISIKEEEYNYEPAPFQIPAHYSARSKWFAQHR